MKLNNSVSESIHQSGESEKGSTSLNRVARQWDPRITRALKRLGNEIWPNAFWRGVIPLPRFRLRQGSRPGARVWWIEHDIPPYDRYRCAAYQVELSLDKKGNAVICIKNGIKTRTLAGSDLVPIPSKGFNGIGTLVSILSKTSNGIGTLANLESLLADAGREPPMIIHRDFGPAND